MILKSKSKLFKDIIEKIDEQLDVTPAYDIAGTPMQDSTWMSMHIDALKDIEVVDELGKKHNPINESVATTLVFDEIQNKQEDEC
tara:strand:+ start:5140 stop:5394 length:255 start_codon:yes stop_codon:yes gene_type:complete